MDVKYALIQADVTVVKNKRTSDDFLAIGLFNGSVSIHRLSSLNVILKNTVGFPSVLILMLLLHPFFLI